MTENPTQTKYRRGYSGFLNWELHVVGVVHTSLGLGVQTVSSALCLFVALCLSASLITTVFFLGSLYGSISLVATSILTAWDQSAKETSMSIPQRGLG